MPSAQGKERDWETGLDYVEARYYDPAIGMFRQVDPHFDKYLTINPFNYAFNNPMMIIDPTGMENTVYVEVRENAGLSEEEKKKLIAKMNEMYKEAGLDITVQVGTAEDMDETNTDSHVIITTTDDKDFKELNQGRSTEGVAGRNFGSKGSFVLVNNIKKNGGNVNNIAKTSLHEDTHQRFNKHKIKRSIPTTKFDKDHHYIDDKYPSKNGKGFVPVMKAPLSDHDQYLISRGRFGFHEVTIRLLKKTIK